MEITNGNGNQAMQPTLSKYYFCERVVLAKPSQARLGKGLDVHTQRKAATQNRSHASHAIQVRTSVELHEYG